MNKKLFEEFKASCAEHVKIARGEKKASRKTTVSPKVRTLRAKLNLTQEEFSRMMGVSVWTLRNWEQGRRNPEGAAGTVLLIAEREPEALLRALHG